MKDSINTTLDDKKKEFYVLPKEDFGGKIHEKNKLNDLSGSGWQYWTKTVITKSYPSNLQHKLRSQHGGQKPPELCADLIKVFTKQGDLVLDPLTGVGGTLLGAAISQRKGLGIELNKQWIDIYEKVCELENIENFKVYEGDCNVHLDCIVDNSIDFILTDVPYWIMDKLKKTRSKVARESKLSNFNEEELQTKEDWLKEMRQIFEKSAKKLKDNKYLAVFIGDLYRGKEYHFLSGELALELSKIESLNLKSDLIWLDNSKMLHIYGYPSAYVPSIIHQHILIFRKEI